MQRQMQKQQGMTFIGLVLMIAMIVFVAVIGMKVLPYYAEHMTIKKILHSVAEDNVGKPKSAIQEAFRKAASIDDIKSIDKTDLEISSTDAGTVISTEYQVVVPLFANVSALLDFTASSDE